MIQGEFEDAKRAKAVRSSHDDFGLAVKAFHDPARELPARFGSSSTTTPVQPERSGEFLNRLEAAAPDLVTPEAVELSAQTGELQVQNCCYKLTVVNKIK